MSKKRLLILGLLCCGWRAGLAADPAGPTPQLSACLDKAGGVTSEVLDCIGAETKRQDARLNRAYRALMAQLPAGRQKPLQEAQRAWLRFRDANCQFVADPDGGTMAVVEANDCFMSSTAARAAELEAFRR